LRSSVCLAVKNAIFYRFKDGVFQAGYRCVKKAIQRNVNAAKKYDRKYLALEMGTSSRKASKTTLALKTDGKTLGEFLR